jgi:DNA-directed RNA polymerase subunit N (RpoN/RPB10)
MSTIRRTPPVCWSCGRTLPEEDYDRYHDRCDKGEISQIVLDEMGYPLPCCRRFFLGDDKEYRRILSLYDMSTINNAPHL